jgi:predicted nucleotidyltransferase
LYQRIQKALSDIETSEDVKILYACESGSRAWGFASSDSDYDVRFIYVHPPSWYLSINLEKKRDIIELPIEDLLDVSGWDLRKALNLFRKSNPPLLEWLGSPIVYREEFNTAKRLRELLDTYYSPTASAYHYLHMAKSNHREYIKGDTVWRKKYLYVLRPILAIKWLEADKGVVPTEFQKLLEAMVPAGSLRTAIDDLLREKAAGGELDRGPKIPEINEFLLNELERLEETRFAREPAESPVDLLDKLFQQKLKEAYGGTQW